LVSQHQQIIDFVPQSKSRLSSIAQLNAERRANTRFQYMENPWNLFAARSGHSADFSGVTHGSDGSKRFGRRDGSL
jgi:hypothetical protein